MVRTRCEGLCAEPSNPAPSARAPPSPLSLAALEILVDNRVTGLPVVDANNVVVGVVSDYDLLALESFSKVAEKSPGAVNDGMSGMGLVLVSAPPVRLARGS